MKTYRYALPLALFLGIASTSASAADLNGYTAEYECRAGGPHCDVNISSYVSQSCQQTITTSDSEETIEGKLNGGSQFICVEPGDYTGREIIDIQASGSASAYKVLRYTRSGDNDDEPWNQASRANFRSLRINAAYWILHRISFPTWGGAQSDTYRVWVRPGSNNIIVNRSLLEGLGSGAVGIYAAIGGTEINDITLQNSVVRENYGANGNWAGAGVAFESGANLRIVNNEIYNLSERLIQLGHDFGGYLPGTVVENNDLYTTPSFDGGTQGLNAQKGYGEDGNPTRWINNRLNRSRNATWAAEGGGEGRMISLADDQNTDCAAGWGADWTLIQNNVFVDGITGVHGWRYCKERVSIIGNIFYDMKWDGGSTGQAEASAMNIGMLHNAEAYFNTVVKATRWALLPPYWGDGDHNDVMSNVVIGSGVGGDPQGDYDVRYNMFYDSSALGSNNLIRSISTINGPLCTELGCTSTVNTSGRTIGDIVRTNSDPLSCTSSTDDDCFLYKVETVGTSGTVRAIRGPYAYFWKLKTNPQQAVIPYVRVHESAPEVGLDPGNAGNRPDIGINNDAPGTGILAADSKGTTRMGTPGALEAGGGGSPPPPPPPPGQTPYGDTAWTIPGLIEAEHFDEGGQGIAYDDTTSGNEGSAFRSEGVDLESSSENGYNIGWTQPGEWVEFTVDVDATGDYRIDVRVASAGPGGVLHVEVDGVDVTGPLTVPDTGGWQSWQTLTREGVNLTAGPHVLRLAFDVAGATGDIGNVNYINVTQAGGSSPPSCYAPFEAPIAIPGTIEAEHYDLGGEGCAYHDTTPENEPGAYRTDGVDVFPIENDGGVYGVGWVTSGEWLQYSVNVATAGTYTLEVRYATQGFGGNMHIEFAGQNKTGSIALPDTGGWQTWSTVSVPVTLDAGPQIMRLSFDTAGPDGWLANINYVRITAGTSQPSLSGTLATPPPLVSLTTEGTADWIHWGLIDETSVNRKSGIAPVLGDYTVIGTSPVQRYDDNPSGFTWSDGTPTVSVANTPTYLYVTGVGNGFEYRVPADTTLRTVKVYVGVWAAQGQLTATLSDDSASPYSDNSLINTTDHTHGAYTFQYRAASSGQSLVIRWSATNNYHQYGSMTWQAVTLRNGGS